jgi:hypothetical protein
VWYQFLSENFHFAINLFTALAFFSIFWLYFDAWIDRKNFKEGFKIVGYLLLSIAFLLHATYIESGVLTTSIINIGFSEKLAIILKNIGYFLLLIGLIIDPLQPKPNLNKIPLHSLVISPAIAVSFLISPVLTILIAWLYLRRATVGLENHIKKVSLSFFFFAIYEVLNTPSIFINSLNVDIFRLVAPFGPIWIAAHFFQAIAAGVLVFWAFSYLLKRINTQLFIIFTTVILSIFLLTAVSFTFLLLKNLSDETLTRLDTDVSVLSFSLDSKKSESLAFASILSNNSAVVEAVANKDKKILSQESEKLLVSHQINSLVVVDENGQVLARGEDRDRTGDSLSDDSLVKRALIGEQISSLVSVQGAIAPSVLVRAATPITSDENIIGAVVVAITLDNSFLDGIKEYTGLEAGIYGGDVLSATTISDLKGQTRPIGIKESSLDIKDNVLTKGENYKGLVSLLNTSYFAVYRPLKDVDNEVVGMLLVGRPAVSIFATAGKSIELTFLVTIVLVLLSIFPSYFISKYITNQLR